MDTPRISSGDCYAQEAKSFLIEKLFGKWVWLTFDGNCYDFYDRTVHLGTNEQDFIERQLLLGGYAQAFPFDDTDTFEDLFMKMSQPLARIMLVVGLPVDGKEDRRDRHCGVSAVIYSIIRSIVVCTPTERTSALL